MLHCLFMAMTLNESVPASDPDHSDKAHLERRPHDGWFRRCDGSLVQQSRTFFLSFPRLFVRFTCNSCQLAVKQFSLKLLLCLCRDKFSFIIKFSSDTQRVLQYQPNLSIVEAFGYFGGYIGIWLGFSLLSVLLNLEEHMAKMFAKRMQRVKAADDTVMVLRLKQRF
ncbi:uncharacterized protein LOC125942862 [Dermacentor silvarum]|uniref:uncharacterized protein LOC125942862 n=1 Tax=Dermacentor silvarum TaxID=543639 RepID=UPI002100DD71|nr:uncharacterized protein LOC125942862 [Dermacentor silvarum]